MLWMEVMHAMLDLPRCHGPLHKESLAWDESRLPSHHPRSVVKTATRESTASFRVRPEDLTPPARLPTNKYFPSPLL
jgi:hypothetical protein